MTLILWHQQKKNPQTIEFARHIFYNKFCVNIRKSLNIGKSYESLVHRRTTILWGFWKWNQPYVIVYVDFSMVFRCHSTVPSCKIYGDGCICVGYVPPFLRTSSGTSTLNSMWPKFLARQDAANRRLCYSSWNMFHWTPNIEVDSIQR